MRLLFISILIFLYEWFPVFGQEVRHQEIILSNKSSITFARGWSFDRSARKLTVPEGDLTLHLITRRMEGSMAELSAGLWKTIHGGFDHKIAQEMSIPSEGGWERTHQIIYEVPAVSARSIWSFIRVFKGMAFAVLVEGSNATINKRRSQTQLVIGSWRPLGMVEESFAKQKARRFSSGDAREMEAFVTKAMGGLGIPGISLALIQGGEVVYRRGFGVKRVGQTENISPRTLFQIGSVTKPLTTLMLSKLVEMGKFRWETPLQEILPEFKMDDPSLGRKIQVRHSVCACTGMPRRDADFVFGSKNPSPADTLRLLGGMKPSTGFGETFQYSNYLVAVGGFAGANAYRKGGSLLDKYQAAMTDLVFLPLGMADTRISLKGQGHDAAVPHSRNLSGKMVEVLGREGETHLSLAPSGSIWSNIDDLSNYVMMELREGKLRDGTQVFSRAQIMGRRRPGIMVDANTHYGLGLSLKNDRGLRVVRHGGNTPGFTAEMFFIPDHGLGFVMLVNAGDLGVSVFGRAVYEKFLEIFFRSGKKSDEMLEFGFQQVEKEKLRIEKRISTREENLRWISSYVGRYENEDLGPVEIRKTLHGFQFWTPLWSSTIGSVNEEGGEKLIALIDPPWLDRYELQVQARPRKLILQDYQVKYEFDVTSKGSR